MSRTEVSRATGRLSSTQKDDENIDSGDWRNDNQCPKVKGDLPVVYTASTPKIEN